MLQSLERQSGLPIAFDPGAAAIHRPPAVVGGEESVRTAEAMQEYVSDPSARPTQETVYTVYRNLARPQDAAAIAHAQVRYDMTVIRPGFFIGERKEFFRTAGHYHSLKAESGIAYPEVYEVISGRAYWLLQRPAAEEPARLEEIYLVEAGPGEKAVMLPGFGHISVNVHSEPLILSNWINDTFGYNYEPYQRFRGGGYWVVERTPDLIEFEKNPHYREVPELSKLRPREVPEFGLLKSRPAYSLASELAKLRFLNAPEEFLSLLTLENCYRAL